MSTPTPNYGINKNDFANDIFNKALEDNQNSNMDIIDKQMKNNADDIQTEKGDRESALTSETSARESGDTQLQTNLDNTNTRIDELISGSPQPSEVVDARTSGVSGITYSVLKSRLDFMEEKGNTTNYIPTHYIASLNGETNIPIQVATYDKTNDWLDVIYNGAVMIKDLNYTIAADGISIDLIGFSISIGERIDFYILKNVEITDQQPPNDVSNLVANGNSLAGNRVEITWTDPIDSDLTNITVRRKTGAFIGGDANEGALIANVGKGIEEVLDITAVTGNTYYYKLFPGDGTNINTLAGHNETGAINVTNDYTPPGDVTDLVAISDNSEVTIIWTDPTDSDWAGTLIRRKTTPWSSFDGHTTGTLVLDSKSRNQYQTIGYVNGGLTNGVKLFYKLFPYDNLNNYNETIGKNEISATPSIQKIYGIRYVDNGTDFTYTRLEDAVGKTTVRSATKSIGSYTGRDITSTFFDVGEKIFPNLKRVILNNDGVVAYTEGDAGFDDTLSTGGLAPNTHSVMVQIPRFYYLIKYITSGYEVYVSNNAFDIGGTNAWIHPAFYRDRDGNGVAEEVGYRYFPAFEGVLYDNSQSKCITGNENNDNTANVDLNNDLICSFNTIGYDGQADGLRPYSGLTIGETRTLCENRNTATQKAWGQSDFNLLCAIQALYKVVFADFDSQNVLSKGFTATTATGASGNNAKPCGVGHSSVLNGKSGYVNVLKYYDGTSVVDSNDNVGTEAMSLFGIENFYGNVRKWIDGLATTSTHHIGIWNKNFSSLSTTDLTTADKDIDMSSVWTANIEGYMDSTWRDSDNANSKYLGDIIKTSGGSDSTYYADYAYLGAGAVPFFGGYWRNGMGAGAFYLYVSYSLSVAISGVGGALSL